MARVQLLRGGEGIAGKRRSTWTAVYEGSGALPPVRENSAFTPQAGREKELQVTARLWQADLSPTRLCFG